MKKIWRVLLYYDDIYMEDSDVRARRGPRARSRATSSPLSS